MNTKTTAIVVVIAVALGVYFLVFERDLIKGKTQTQTTMPTGETAGQALLPEKSITGEKVTRLKVEKPDQPPVVIEKIDKAWTQVQPVKFPLQSWDIDKVVSDAAALRYTTKFKPSSNDVKLEQLGLSPARVTLTLETEGKATTVYLGKRTAAGGAYVALGKPTESTDVYVVNDALHGDLLEKDLKEWRSRTPAAAAPAAGTVRRVSLKRGAENIELVQSDGKWVLEKPVGGRADRDAAQQLSRVPNEAHIAQFVRDKPDDLAAYGLTDPQIVLTVESAESSPPIPEKKEEKKDEKGKEKKAKDLKPEPKVTTHKLAVGGAQSLSEDNFFAMWDDLPVVFTIGKFDVQKLRRPVKELRDPRLTPADKTQVREVLLQQPDDKLLHLIKDAGAWKFGDGAPGYGIDSGRVDELLKAIFDTKAQDYTAADAAKLGKPLSTVTLALTGSEQGEKLAIYKGQGDKYLCMRGSEATVYIVDSKALDPIFRPTIAYRDRTVLDIKQEDVTELHLSRTGENAADYRIARAPGADAKAPPGDWKLEGFDRGAFQALIDRIAPLMADQWLVDTPGAAPQGVTIELTLKDGGKKKVSLDPISRIALADGVKGGFKVDQDLAKAATAELRDRVVLKTDAGQIATVKLDKAVIDRDSNGIYKIEGGQGLDEQKAAKIYDALAGLSAQRFLPKEATAKLGQPIHKLNVITRKDEKYTLSLWSPNPAKGKNWIGRLDGGEPFTLETATAEKLLGQPPSREEPLK